MRIIFPCLVIFTNGINLTPRDFADFDQKLRIYQNITGIDDATFNEIWDAGITNGKNFRQLIVFTYIDSKSFFQFRITWLKRHKVLQLDMALLN